MNNFYQSTRVYLLFIIFSINTCKTLRLEKVKYMGKLRKIGCNSNRSVKSLCKIFKNSLKPEDFYFYCRIKENKYQLSN